jgi:hypothetical protein
MSRFRIWGRKPLTSVSSVTLSISPLGKCRSSITIRPLRILLHSCIITLFSTPHFRLLPRCNSGPTSCEITFLGLLPLEDGPIGCLETSFINYQHMLCNVTESDGLNVIFWYTHNSQSSYPFETTLKGGNVLHKLIIKVSDLGFYGQWVSGLQSSEKLLYILVERYEYFAKLPWK